MRHEIMDYLFKHYYGTTQEIINAIALGEDQIVQGLDRKEPTAAIADQIAQKSALAHKAPCPDCGGGPK